MINGPADIKKLDPDQLDRLCDEVRRRIIETVALRGGHLASSLGVVELTISLLYTYNLPADKVIYDVGHQCYAHKILTGRNNDFDTLRAKGGLSGFPKRDESEYDAFDTGHAGTSISAALGMARARDYLGRKNKVLAVIGDGSMTAGLAFEGLNHAGSLGSDFTVVLNDNKMSISQNIGALSHYLNRIITGGWYNRARKESYEIMRSILKNQLTDFAARIEKGVKGVFIPGKLFEDLGFKYIGPIDGHEVKYLNETFEAVKNLHEPVLVHVVTTKGKGYGPAEEKAVSFHGVSPFHPKTGNSKSTGKSLSYTSIFADTLIELAKDDDRIIGITAAMPEGTGLSKFAEVYPDRFYDVGIAEQHATTFAAGLSVEGLKPVVAIYSTFLQRLYDQVVHDVCLTNLDVTFAIDRAGIVGEDGATHQGLYDLAILRTIPNMVIMAPKDGDELKSLLKIAVEYNGPSAVRYPRGSAPVLQNDGEMESIKIGEGEILREGSDVAVFAIGSVVNEAISAAQILQSKGYDCAVVNARFVKPLDTGLLFQMGEKCGLIVTVEEGCLAGGFGSAVAEEIEKLNIPHRAMRRIGIEDHFVEHGSQDILRAEEGIDAEGIARQTISFLAEMGIMPGQSAEVTPKVI